MSESVCVLDARGGGRTKTPEIYILQKPVKYAVSGFLVVVIDFKWPGTGTLTNNNCGVTLVSHVLKTNAMATLRNCFILLFSFTYKWRVRDREMEERDL